MNTPFRAGYARRMSSENSACLLDGRYRLVEPLARGGTAIVWRARDERLGRLVAVKMLADGADTAYVRSEAQALARLSHPHVASVFDYADRADRAYLVMEFVDGQSLGSVLARRELPWETAVACGAQVASALAAAHARGLVHRDVKPGNIMLTRSGVKLVDFGICAVEGERESDSNGGLRGTPAYVAPERLHNKTVLPAGDIYSLGVVLFRTLSGDLPPDRGATLPTNVPDPVAEICLRCLAPNPDDRPSADELEDVLATAMPSNAGSELVYLLAPSDMLAAPTHVITPLASTQAMSHPLSRSLMPALPAYVRSRGRLVAVATGVILLGVLAWSTTRSPSPVSVAAAQGPACDVTYQLQSDNGRQFLAAITASNGGERVATGWRLSMRVPAGGFVAGEGWQNDSGIVSSPAQPALEPGTSAQLSLSGSHGGVLPMPTVFQLNGDQCEATLLGPPSTPAVAPPVAPPVAQPAAQSTNARMSSGDESKKRQGHGGKRGKDHG